MGTSVDLVAAVAVQAGMHGSSEALGKAKTANEEKQEQQPAQDIHAVVAQANAALRMAGTRLLFSVDDVTKETVVTVVDQDTGEVIRQIPSETMLKISESITRLLGAIFDKLV
ncbi:MAG TPA: flagellar protein FlaG [Bacteroidota bacterium]|nr:flagellar protein FlaG [Bacteroidota bacterium]